MENENHKVVGTDGVVEPVIQPGAKAPGVVVPGGGEPPTAEEQEAARLALEAERAASDAREVEDVERAWGLSVVGSADEAADVARAIGTAASGTTTPGAFAPGCITGSTTPSVLSLIHI